MATYEELYDLRSNTLLRNKVAVAVVVAAEAKLTGTPTAAEAKWARSVVANPNNAANETLNLVLAANKDIAAGAISSASDTAIQSNVDSVVDGLIAGEV